MPDELRLAASEDWHEVHDGYGCAVVIGCVIIFWAAVIAAVALVVSVS